MTPPYEEEQPPMRKAPDPYAERPEAPAPYQEPPPTPLALKPGPSRVRRIPRRVKAVIRNGAWGKLFRGRPAARMIEERMKAPPRPPGAEPDVQDFEPFDVRTDVSRDVMGAGIFTDPFAGGATRVPGYTVQLSGAPFQWDPPRRLERAELQRVVSAARQLQAEEQLEDENAMNEAARRLGLG